MADELDQTQARIENETALLIADVCRCAKGIDPGEAGDCYYCGETFSRVVCVEDPATEAHVKSCGRCRDRRGIK